MKKNKEVMKSILAQNITARRKSRGWNQSDLATKVGVHLNTIKALETDNSEGELATREAVAQALGCELWELYRGPSHAAPNRDVSFAAAFLSQFASLSELHQGVILTLAYGDESYLSGSTPAPLRRALVLLKDV